MNNPLSKVTRLEVIDESGRVYVRDPRVGDAIKVELSFQDGGRTLKVFVNGRREVMATNPPQVSDELRTIDPFGYEFYRGLLDEIYAAGMAGKDHYHLKDSADRYVVNLLAAHTAKQAEAPTKADSQGLDVLSPKLEDCIDDLCSVTKDPEGSARYLRVLIQAYAQNLSDERVDAYHKEITDNEKKVWIYRNDLDGRIAKARREGKLEAARHFKNYMISNSPFIEQIIDPYITQLTKGDNTNPNPRPQ